MSKKLILELSMYTDGDWGYDTSIFQNHTSRYFDNDLYEYTYLDDHTTKIRRVYGENENGFAAMINLLQHICDTIHGRKSDTIIVKAFLMGSIICLDKNETFCDDYDGNTEIDIDVKLVENDSKPIKQIIYEE